MKKAFVIIWGMTLIQMFNPFLKYFLRFEYAPFGLVFCGVVLLFIFIKMITFVLKHERFHWLILDSLFLCFIFIGFLYFVLSNQRILAIEGFKENFKLVYVYFFVRFLDPDEKQISAYFYTLFILAVCISFYGIYQYFFDYFYIAYKFDFIKDETYHKYFGMAALSGGRRITRRAYSIFPSWQVFALTVSFALIYFFTNFIVIYRKWDFKRAAVTCLLIVALVLSFSRTCYLATAVAMFFIWYYFPERAFKFKTVLTVSVILIPLTFGMAFYLPPNLSDALVERVMSIASFDYTRTDGHVADMQLYLILLFANFFGRGLGTSEPWTSLWVESSFFRYTVEIGTISGIVLIFIFGYFFKYALSVLQSEKIETEKRLPLFAIAITAFFAVAGIPFPVWFSWYPGILVWTSMAYVTNCYSKLKK